MNLIIQATNPKAQVVLKVSPQLKENIFKLAYYIHGEADWEQTGISVREARRRAVEVFWGVRYRRVTAYKFVVDRKHS